MNTPQCKARRAIAHEEMEFQQMKLRLRVAAEAGDPHAANCLEYCELMENLRAVIHRAACSLSAPHLATALPQSAIGSLPTPEFVRARYALLKKAAESPTRRHPRVLSRPENLPSDHTNSSYKSLVRSIYGKIEQ